MCSWHTVAVKLFTLIAVQSQGIVKLLAKAQNNVDRLTNERGAYHSQKSEIFALMRKANDKRSAYAFMWK